MLRNKDDSFTLRFEKPICVTHQPQANKKDIIHDDKNEELVELITRYKIILEDYIKEHPEQWYMFRRFWAI
jgi:predicted LPLAT superfamily acyltransferase